MRIIQWHFETVWAATLICFSLGLPGGAAARAASPEPPTLPDELTLDRGASGCRPTRPAYLQIINPADEQQEPRETGRKRRPGYRPPATMPADSRPATRLDQGPLSAELPAVVIEGQAPSPCARTTWSAPTSNPAGPPKPASSPAPASTSNRGVRRVRVSGSAPTVPRHGQDRVSATCTSWRWACPTAFNWTFTCARRASAAARRRSASPSSCATPSPSGTRSGATPRCTSSGAGWRTRPTPSRPSCCSAATSPPAGTGASTSPTSSNTGADRENEIQFTAGVSYALVDDKFSIGMETIDSIVDTNRRRGRFDDKSFFVGPSIRYHATDRSRSTSPRCSA